MHAPTRTAGGSGDRDVLADRMAGLLLGQAVGDAIGLPREGLGPQRATRLFGGPPLGHRLLPGIGLCSDDTEHACMTAVALLRGWESARTFSRALGWQLRGWFLTLPVGLGLATAKACVKLCLGFPAGRSGVWSAGNGPAMRATIVGAALGGDDVRLGAFVGASTTITHRDPRAEEAAVVVALAAAEAVARGADIDGPELVARLVARIEDEQLRDWLRTVGRMVGERAKPAELVRTMGLSKGVSGYINHTVPVVLFCWLRYLGDFRRTVEAVVMLGGDADTTAALAGGLAGATLGEAGIPADWLHGVREWPRTREYMRRLAGCLARRVGGEEGVRPPRWFWPGLIVRNAVFLGVVLGHGFRRLFPPY